MLALYLWVRAWLQGLLAREEGQTLAEYALILVLIAVVVIIVLTALGGQIRAVFQQIVDALGG